MKHFGEHKLRKHFWLNVLLEAHRQDLANITAADDAQFIEMATLELVRIVDSEFTSPVGVPLAESFLVRFTPVIGLRTRIFIWIYFWIKI